MKIIVDAFGGDNAPLAIIKGSIDAKNEYGIDIVLVGKEDEIKKVAKENEIALTGVEIVDAPDVMTMNDIPTEIVKSKSNCSMAVGLKHLANGGGDGFISAGNSGALCVGSSLIVKRIKGIKRPGFAAEVPTMDSYFMLMDTGANVSCKPEMLHQFAIMSSIYMNKIWGIENPRVGLANVGVEEHKGGKLQWEAYSILKNSKLINFIGNVEGRDIPMGACDVVVCDGFTGNMILKTYEGVAIALMKQIKGIFTKNLKNKLAAGVLLKDMNVLKQKFNTNEHSSAPILGVRQPVFKAHGSANAEAFKNSIKDLTKFIETNVIKEISESVKTLKEDKDSE